jgi:hypothetical protein
MNDYTDKGEDEYDYITYTYKYFGDQTDNEIIYTPHSQQTAKVAEISEQDIFENFISPSGLEIERQERINKLEKNKKSF